MGIRGMVDQRRASNIAMAGLGGLGEPKWLRVTSVYPSFNIQDFLLFLSQSSHGSFSLAPFVSFRLL